MENTAHRAIAIVGAGAILPDSPNVPAFWENLKAGRYSISEVDPARWDPTVYYDPDPHAPDKSYSKIGGWVREFTWDPRAWRLPIPPRVVDAMDGSQKWAIACAREALTDYGYPDRAIDLDRTAVILGNAMGGERHYFTVMRVYFPEYEHELAESTSFAKLPASLREEIVRELQARMGKHLPEITEDSMPGELANCIAGRIANIFNFHGPNYVCDAACASAMAAINAAAEGLIQHHYDIAVTGGIDRNMGVSTFVKFCKIGALSATGTRPYAEGADGFVMGEGAAILLLKRLADAERDGDKIYAVLRGMGGSSDGKGKGITAPNPIGQKFAIERAWQNAGLSPKTVSYIEGHGTSTRVGDVVEVQSAAEVLNGFALPSHSVALGSVKSNIGHLKGAAGAAGFLKAALSLHYKTLPPSVHCEHPNPDIDFAHSPLYVNTALQSWEIAPDKVRRAGLSAFGFGGTNFHAVLEEYIPHRLNGNGKRTIAVNEIPQKAPEADMSNTAVGVLATPAQALVESSRFTNNACFSPASDSMCKPPLRGVLLLGAESEIALIERVRVIEKEAQAGRAPKIDAPKQADLRAPERLAIDYADAKELAAKSAAALKALAAKQPAIWKALRAQGIFRGTGPATKVAFLYPGQGSQYVNMLQPLRDSEPIVADTFAEADRIMTPILGKPLSDFVFANRDDATALAQAEEDLRQTAITQPAVLTADLALTRLLAAYGITPDFAMGHSLGEYGALVAVDAMPFADALEAVSARGREMTRYSPADKGRMAAVFAPLEEIERILQSVAGYVVIANINSEHQSVIGGASLAVEQAMAALQKAGYDVSPLPVSHAFHTSIVAPASEPLRSVLERLRLQSPRLPIVANINGEFYPTGAGVVPRMLDILAQQVAAPVQFIKGLRTLYAAGARTFIEVGPKKALQGFAEDVLGGNGDVVSIFSNHPKVGDIISFNQALCCLYAAGLGRGTADAVRETAAASAFTAALPATPVLPVPTASASVSHPVPPTLPLNGNSHQKLESLFAEFLERSRQIYEREHSAPSSEPVVITGAALGLPGTDRIFDDSNFARILRGDQLIDSIPVQFRKAMLDKSITRLVKSDNGDPRFETINDIGEVIKLAGRGHAFDLQAEFGISADRIAALDRVTQLAMAAGLDALRDAGIPLVLRYKTTSKGTQLPDRWGLPDALRDSTGVIFASAFPGLDSFADETRRYYSDQARREQLATLENLRSHAANSNGHSDISLELDRRIGDLRNAIEKDPYVFERRFLLRTLSMGHSQFAEFIGARGPNTQINSACASTTQAIALAEDWIRAGRCSRVIVISADDVTSDHLIDWMGAGFLASGAAATDEAVADAATPFDRRRHGLIVGMGAAALVLESAHAANERGLHPICEVLSTVTANSAFHGTRLDVQHIGQVMEKLVADAEARTNISRREIAPQMVFVSHETYTPARGGSASAEIHALRRVFGDDADCIVIANTKGMTGHAMGTGIEDVLAVKTLETGCVPPVANFKEVDPELGKLNLSKGGNYPVEYAIHLGAGFGSQISMILLRWVKTADGLHRNPVELGYAYRISDSAKWEQWLSTITGREATNLEIVHRTLRVRDKAEVVQTAQPVRESKPVAVSAPAKAEPSFDTNFAKPVPLIEPATKIHIVSPAPPDAPAVQPEPRGNAVKEKVLTLVAEKTGYPVDMLDLDLDLEADLGIDTVKQAEVFASIREAYGIPRDETRKLRDYPTLAHVIGFVYEKRPDLVVADTRPDAASIPAVAPTPATKEPSSAPPAPSSAPQDLGDAVKERILALVVEKTGYPKDMLDLDLDLEADLGVDTVKQAEMFAAIREIYTIPRDENRKLRDYPTLAHVIRFVFEKRPDLLSPVAAPVESSVATPADSVAVSVASSRTNDSIEQMVLNIVADKTGYPKDMLELDLDLEADLGIDTVKQAEMFAAIRAAYSIPRDENLKLRNFPTLAHVIKFAQDRAGATGTQPQSAAPAKRADVSLPPASSIPAKSARAVASLEPANQIPRRVPIAVLRPPLSMCKTTGIELGAGCRIVLMPDTGGVADTLERQLEAKGVEILRIPPSADSIGLTNLLQAWMAAGPIDGVYWLPALDHEGELQHMGTAAWHEAIRTRLKSLYVTMRALYEQIAAPGKFFLAATRLGGQHGYDEAGAFAPLGGAVTGFTKTYKRERLDALVKAVDFEAGCLPQEIADLLIAETIRDTGAVEIGYKQGLRWTIGLEERSAIDHQPGMRLDSNTVFLITGAAGSIVSAITADLAAASGGIFYLLDLVPEPDPANPDLKRFRNERESLKRDLFARIQARGERATPALVEKELAALERAQAALSAIEAVRAAGGTAHYFSVNLTDGDAVAKVIAQVRERSGRIDVLLHAAGIERSRALGDKDAREFDLVFDVKSDGFFHLLRAIGDMPLGATVAFSSIAGRYGNPGQTDYSSANDLLCKISSSFRSTRPGTRGIAIDWTAWGGIGMASRGSIPKVMESAGIDMLPPEAGVLVVRRELTSGGTRGEVVIGQRLGALLKEWDSTGGIDTSFEVLAGQKQLGRGPMTGKVASMGLYSGLTIETTLDPKQQPFLHDHQIDGTPVLPGVMGIEAFAEAAQCTLPGWHIRQIESVDFLAPFKFYRHEPRSVVIESSIYCHGDELVADCRLIGRRTLPNQPEPQSTIHFTGRARLSKATQQSISVPAVMLSSPTVEAADIYHLYFHGPAYQVLERASWNGKEMVGLLADHLPENHFPPTLAARMMPRLIELCFQTAGLWEIATQGRMGLPLHVDRVSAFYDTLPPQGQRLYAVVTPNPTDGTFDARVTDAAGTQYVLLSGYRTVATPNAVSAEDRKALQTIMSPEPVAA